MKRVVDLSIVVNVKAGIGGSAAFFQGRAA